MNNYFKVVVPFRNVERYIARCVRSIAKQEYHNWSCELVDDMSDDETMSVASVIINGDPHFKYILNETRKMALQNIYDAIQREQNEDAIIVTVDGDDCLLSPEVLSTLDEIYSKTNCWMTYGSYMEIPTMVPGQFCRNIPSDVVEHGYYRDFAWCSSHLRTFRKKLWNHIEKEDLTSPDGTMFETAWDLAFMFPMLEMAREKAVFVDIPLYGYNTINPLNDHKVDPKKQRDYDKLIRGKKPYAKRTEL